MQVWKYVIVGLMVLGVALPAFAQEEGTKMEATDFRVPFVSDDPGPWHVLFHDIAKNARTADEMGIGMFPVAGDFRACKAAAEGFVHTYPGRNFVEVFCLNARDGRVSELLYKSRERYGIGVRVQQDQPDLAPVLVPDR